jgi:hypothetical protein
MSKANIYLYLFDNHIYFNFNNCFFIIKYDSIINNVLATFCDSLSEYDLYIKSSWKIKIVKNDYIGKDYIF